MYRRYLIIFLVILSEIGIYLYSKSISADPDIFYSLCARYSARISFILLCTLGIWLTFKGIKPIYQSQKSRDWLLGGLFAFTINHLIHFYFLFKNFEVNNLDIISKIPSFGALGYIILTVVPIYLWNKDKLTKSIAILIYGFVMLMIGICVYTYSTRFSTQLPLPPPKLYFQFGILTGSVIIAMLLWRSISDLRNNVF